MRRSSSTSPSWAAGWREICSPASCAAALPELRIGLFERSTATSYKVGEATVEIAANHLIRRLGLSSYLYEHQLPKNGLRYFFDGERRDLPLHEMSEIGTLNLPFHPAFQLDRARMEADLLDLEPARRGPGSPRRERAGSRAGRARARRTASR